MYAKFKLSHTDSHKRSIYKRDTIYICRVLLQAQCIIRENVYINKFGIIKCFNISFLSICWQLAFLIAADKNLGAEYGDYSFAVYFWIVYIVLIDNA